MSQRVIGLDLGTYSIKMVELARASRGFSFERAFEARIPLDPKISREEAQVVVLNEQFGQFDLDQKIVICAVPGHQAAARLLAMPLSDRKKLEKMVPYEIENQSLLELDEIENDWEIIKQAQTTAADSESGEPPTSILTVSVLKKYFETFYNSLQRATIDPRDITSDALALSFLQHPRGNQDSGCIGLIDCGHTKTNICIVNDGEPVFCRTIAIGGRELSRVLEQDFKLSFLEAETLKVTDGTLLVRSGPGVSAEAEKISASLRRVVDELAAEIRQIIIFCHETFRLRVGEFHLFGGTSKLRNLGPYLSASLGVPLKRVNYFERFGVLEVSEEQALSLHGAFSLAIRGVEGSPHRFINFRKGDYRFKQSLRGSEPLMRRAGFMAAIITLLLALNFVGRSIILSAQSTKLDKQIQKEMASIDPSYQYKGPQHALSHVRALLGGESGDNPLFKVIDGKSPLIVFKEISQGIPQDLSITVTDIKIDNRTATFEANAKDRESIAKVRENLSQVSGFTSVREENVTQNGETLKFSVSIALGTDPSAEAKH